MLTTRKTAKLCITCALRVSHSGFPSQRASDVESVSLCRALVDGIFKCILWRNSNFHRSLFQIDNESALVQVMAWRRAGDKPLPEPMQTQFNDAYMRHWVKEYNVVAYGNADDSGNAMVMELLIDGSCKFKCSSGRCDTGDNIVSSVRFLSPVRHMMTQCSSAYMASWHGVTWICATDNAHGYFRVIFNPCGAGPEYICIQSFRDAVNALMPDGARSW